MLSVQIDFHQLSTHSVGGLQQPVLLHICGCPVANARMSLDCCILLYDILLFRTVAAVCFMDMCAHPEYAWPYGLLHV